MKPSCRRLGLALMVFAFALLTGSAEATPGYHVSCEKDFLASAEGASDYQDTLSTGQLGQLSATCGSGPGSANGVVDAGTRRYQQSASVVGTGDVSLGSLSGASESRASVVEPPINPYSAQGRAFQRMEWGDTLTIKSGTLPPGTPVRLRFTLKLESEATTSGLGLCPHPFLASKATATAELLGAVDGSIVDTDCSDPASRSLEAIYDGSVGETIDVGARLELLGNAIADHFHRDVMASLAAGSGSSGTGAASSLKIEAVTSGAYYTTASGQDYSGGVPPDLTAPSITITTPVDGATYEQDSTVNADYGCNDGSGSGMKSCAGDVANGDPIDTATVGSHDFTVNAEDGAGNKEAKTIRYAVSDSKAPSISIATPNDGQSYEQGSTVKADFSCDDGSGSGMKSCAGDVANGDPIDTATVGSHDFTVSAEDEAGNKSSKTVSYTVSDSRAPSISIAAPIDGQTYEQGSAVVADYSCDDGSGSGVKTCAGDVAKGDPIETASAGSHDFTVSTEDEAGNKSSKTVNYTVSDSKAPAISLAIPKDGATYEQGSTVKAEYGCSDGAGSGIKSCKGEVPSDDPIDTASAGSHDFTVSTEDEAGNKSSKTVNYTVSDSQAPSISIDAPKDGATYEQGSTVKAEYGCDDGPGSGVRNCTGDVASGDPVDTKTAGSHSFKVAAEDEAGNKSAKTVNYTVSDTKAPSVSIDVPKDGAGYEQGSAVKADFSCDDGSGSGVKSCVGDVARGDPIDTKTGGSHSFKVSAEDNAGNKDSKTVNYTVSDTKPPSVSIDVPQDGATYEQGSTVEADYGCDDGSGSGVKSCSGDVARGDPLDTASAGSHSFKVAAEDNAGNKDSKTVNYSVSDTKPPSVSIDVPKDGAGYEQGSAVKADFSCDDGSGSGVKSCAGDVAKGDPIDTASAGPHDFKVTAVDEAGNKSSKTVNYTVSDSRAPSISIATPNDGQTYEQGSTAKAEYGCDDGSGSGVKSCVGDVANGDPLDTKAAGSHDFKVSAEDQAGNKQSKTVSYTVSDTKAPSVSIDIPKDGATYEQGSTVTADFACDDGSGSGVKSCVGDVANADPIDTKAAGPNSFTVAAEDNAGNKSSKTVSYTVSDSKPPSIAVTAPEDGATYEQGSTVKADYGCDDGPGSGVKSCTGDVAKGDPVDTASSGPHSFKVTAEDEAGNKDSKTVSYTVSKAIVADTVPPSIIITSPGNGALIEQGAAIKADYGCDDVGSGVKSCSGDVPSGDPIDTRTAGSHSFKVSAEDNAGNKASKTVSYTVADTKAPSISIDVPKDGATYEEGSTVRADYSCDDGAAFSSLGAGVSSCMGDVPRGTPIDTTTAGAHTFTVSAEDEAGNKDSKTVSYTVADTTAPSITITSPKEGATYEQGGPLYAGYDCADSGSGLTRCVGDVQNNDPIGTAPGQRRFTVSAEDRAGNRATRTVTYTVSDTRGPAITITTPKDGATYGQGSNVRADYACDDGAGSGVKSCTGDVPSLSGIDTRTPGPHSFKVTSEDNAGNKDSKSVSYTVVADTQAPSISIATPTNGATYARDAVIRANYVCTDTGVGVKSCAGDVANGDPVDTRTTGSHNFKVSAEDNAGNKVTRTVNYTVAVDTQAPSISVTTPKDGTTYEQGSVTRANYSCTDSLSGIKSCTGDVANGDPIDTRTAGSHSFTVLSTDNAGNRAKQTVNYTVTDTKAPAISIATPRDGRTYEQGVVVVASYTCIDGGGFVNSGSGVKSCAGDVPTGDPIDTRTPGSHRFTVTSEDKAGNKASQTVSYTVSDTKLPVITITTPNDGGAYARDANIKASYRCTDIGSGVKSCSGDVRNGDPIDTSTPGPHSFKVSAEDNVGNKASTSASYWVGPKPVVRVAAGADPAQLQAAKGQFEADLGPLNPNTAGSRPGGRRQITWDDVPRQDLPLDYFDRVSPRGVLLSADSSAPDTRLRVVDPRAIFSRCTQGRSFSQPNVLTSTNDQRQPNFNALNLQFRVPGSGTPAISRGFGVVLTDVFPGTSLELYDRAGSLLGRVPFPGADSGCVPFSFVSVSLAQPMIARARISPGNGGNRGPVDDVVFGEPQP